MIKFTLGHLRSIETTSIKQSAFDDRSVKRRVAEVPADKIRILKPSADKLEWQ